MKRLLALIMSAVMLRTKLYAKPLLYLYGGFVFADTAAVFEFYGILFTWVVMDW